MSFVIKLLIGKLIEALCKYAEKKFTEVKSGSDKKAYVLRKMDEIFDVEVDDDEVVKLKDEAIDYASGKIDRVVSKVINKKEA